MGLLCTKYAWLYYVAMTHDYSHENIYFIDSLIPETICNKLSKKINLDQLG